MKQRITIVVLGHVDHGKSTLVGRFLFEKGIVHAEEIERYATLGAEMGKASFKYAWVMDRSDESRKRGLTLDLNYADVETRRREIHIIDAPGHRDFVRSMITGTTGADAALLVVDSQEGIMPQTREHAQLAKLMGLERVVVAVNKVDKVNYDPEAIGRVATEIRQLLEGLGLMKPDIIPVSAWEGQNITSRGEQMSWYKGRTLEEVLDIVEPRGGPKGGSLRMPVMQVLTVGGVGTVVLGRIERGEVKEGDELLVMPVNKVGIVRSIEAYGKKIDKAEAGETVGVALRNIGKLEVSRGDVLGPVDDPPKLVEDFTAKIVLIGDVGIVKLGWSPYIHCHTTAVPVKLEAIEMKLRPDSGEASGEAETSFLIDGDAAIVRMRPLKPLILESTDILPGMSRFALRLGKDTLGAGSCISMRITERLGTTSESESRGFSYKHKKAGSGAKEMKKRKDEERRDIWGKPIEKEKKGKK
jgi:elongation factor 1-alpha